MNLTEAATLISVTFSSRVSDWVGEGKIGFKKGTGLRAGAVVELGGRLWQEVIEGGLDFEDDGKSK